LSGSVIEKPGRLLLLSVLAGVALGGFSFAGESGISWRLTVILANLAAPWALAAFFLGRTTTKARLGALAGGAALAVGVITYYLLGTVAGYVIVPGRWIWLAISIVIGPAMGWCGSLVAAGPSLAPAIAVAAPSMALLSEALFLLLDRKAWRWEVWTLPERWVDLGIALSMLVLALLLPRFLAPNHPRMTRVYVWVCVGGLVGAIGFGLLLEARILI
jgi:hypothetical protein